MEIRKMKKWKKRAPYVYGLREEGKKQKKKKEKKRGIGKGGE